jgi:hypothetical protein
MVILGGDAAVSIGGGNLMSGLRSGIRSEIKGYYHPSYSVHNVPQTGRDWPDKGVTWPSGASAEFRGEKPYRN